MNKHFYEIQIEIENMCLLDCIHCSSVDMRSNGNRCYTDEELLRFISLFQGKLHIYFTGGEPLLYENLLKLCAEIRAVNKNVAIGLYTTGNCFGGKPISDDLARRMSQAGIVDCYFSVYSDVEYEHDVWTAVNGSLSNTIESVEMLKQRGIISKAHLVLNRYNKHKLKAVIRSCSEIGFEEVRILKLTPTGSAIANWDSIGIPIEEQNKLINQLIQEQENYPVKLGFSGYPDLHPCRSWDTAVGCQAGTNLLYVDAEGDVYPCACTKRNPNRFKIAHITELKKLQEYVVSKETTLKNDTCLNEVCD